MTTTLRDATRTLSARGVTLRKADGEYRVSLRVADPEASAYYTNDIDDAVATGYAMARAANGIDAQLRNGVAFLADEIDSAQER